MLLAMFYLRHIVLLLCICCFSCAAPQKHTKSSAAPHGSATKACVSPAPTGDLPKSHLADRSCKGHSDCTFEPRVCGSLAPLPCKDRWSSVVNRAAAKRIAQQNAVIKADCRAHCASAARGRWIGDEAVCIDGLCRAAKKGCPAPGL